MDALLTSSFYSRKFSVQLERIKVRSLMNTKQEAVTDSRTVASVDKRKLYKTAWTLVGGHAFTSQQCVAVRYIGLGQYRINETPETLHEIHLTDFCL